MHDNIMRIKTRIGRADDLTEMQKHPPILSGDHHITRLYIEHTHRQLHHAGAEATINECRQRYYITRIRTARDIIRRCIPCRIKRASPPHLHGDHLSNRLAHHRRPFTYTGIDYFGPLTVKIGRTTNKRYVVFTCLTTRAIHLEIAASLETSSAIMALKRMIARRGCPTEIWSDNGTNLRGAARELHNIFNENMKTEANLKTIRWRFIPPGAPFMGGAWESGSAAAPAPGTFNESDLNSRAQWRVSQLADMFWAAGFGNICPSYNTGGSHGRGEALKIGDVVLIADNTLPRNTWPRGVITAVYPGTDGVTRVADVQTKNGVLRRPTKKIVVIPTDRPSSLKKIRRVTIDDVRREDVRNGHNGSRIIIILYPRHPMTSTLHKILIHDAVITKTDYCPLEAYRRGAEAPQQTLGLTARFCGSGFSLCADLGFVLNSSPNLTLVSDSDPAFNSEPDSLIDSNFDSSTDVALGYKVDVDTFLRPPLCSKSDSDFALYY
ncbi:hypothetical protein EVAR_36670_1 [Eumeta japonica]|uniref:DUF5641 domain-containing protein n=1 Tax=Eumeta variegata TaxID=151549 RepID=A0A4C1ZAJ0_EUMVA|nr:hypothetical protein EVAR_36670_1 [Eumeta japonica]